MSALDPGAKYATLTPVEFHPSGVETLTLELLPIGVVREICILVEGVARGPGSLRRVGFRGSPRGHPR